MKSKMMIICVICFSLFCGCAANRGSNVESLNVEYNFPIEQVMENELFTKIIEGEVFPVQVKYGVGGEAGYVQWSSSDAEVVNAYIQAMRKVQIEQIITNPEEMYVVFDGVEDYIFVLEDGTEVVLGTDLTSYVNNGDVQYVLGETEALRSISIDNTASCWESGNTDIDDLILKMVSLDFDEEFEAFEWLDSQQNCYRIRIKGVLPSDGLYRHKRDYFFYIKENKVYPLEVEYTEEDSDLVPRYAEGECNYDAFLENADLDGKEYLIISIGNDNAQENTKYCAYVLENEEWIFVPRYER